MSFPFGIFFTISNELSSVIVYLALFSFENCIFAGKALYLKNELLGFLSILIFPVSGYLPNPLSIYWGLCILCHLGVFFVIIPFNQLKMPQVINQNSSFNLNDFFIKGDISGIQDFIFSVKSEKAARVLKARSIFIQVLSEISKSYVEQQFLGSDIEEFYNGGGSFYLFLKDQRGTEEVKEELKKVEAILNLRLVKEDIYVALSVISFEDKDNFESYWGTIAKESNKDKLKKFDNSIEAFSPYDYGDEENNQLNWLQFAHYTPKSEAEIEPTNSIIEADTLIVTQKSVEFLDKRLKLKQYPNTNYFKDKIHNVLPEWRKPLYEKYKSVIDEEIERREALKVDQDKKIIIEPGHIIDYHFLAYFAEERTGTRKLGILKLDVDNLGNLFKFMPDYETAKKVSCILSQFFDKDINTFLSYEIPFPKPKSGSERMHYFKDNIYTIFSGGDDCFFVGGWDAILEWADLIRSRFELVAEQIKEAFDQSGKEIDDDLKLPPTISAGIVILEPTYPVIRFSKLAEEAIDSAKYLKYYGEEKPQKNKVALFDQVLTWEEYGISKELSYELKDLIKYKGEPRGVIEKIRSSAADFEDFHKQAFEGKMTGPGVGKLFYYIRNSKNAIPITQKLIVPYARDLIAAFTEQKPTNPMKYPIAARWAEFLTRNIHSDQS